MVEFHVCASLCHDEDSDERLEDFVAELNDKHGHLKCSCHPNDTWHLAVDILKDCTFDIHIYTWQNPKCDYWEKFLKNEVTGAIK